MKLYDKHFLHILSKLEHTKKKGGTHMENKDTIHLLKECDAGSKMAVTSIQDMMGNVQNKDLYTLLKETKAHHEKLGNEIHSMLLQYHCDEKDPNPIAKGMSWMKTNLKLTMDDCDATIADLMTDGCNMGVKSLKKYMNQYPTADSDVKKLCTRLIGIEEQLAKELAQYL